SSLIISNGGLMEHAVGAFKQIRRTLARFKMDLWSLELKIAKDSTGECRTSQHRWTGNVIWTNPCRSGGLRPVGLWLRRVVWAPPEWPGEGLPTDTVIGTVEGHFLFW